MDGPGVNFVAPTSRGRDSLAVTFLAADLISSVIAPGVAARPGVVARMGEPCLAGVVARDTAIFVAASTRDTSPVVSAPNREAVDNCSCGIGSAVIDFRCERLAHAIQNNRSKLDRKHARKQFKPEG